MYFAITQFAFRTCAHSWESLLWDTDGVSLEDDWARSRRQVKARLAEIIEGIAEYNDCLFSVRAALTAVERRSLAAAQVAQESGIVDVGQNFLHRRRITRGGRLPTLLKHTGVLVVYDHSAEANCNRCCGGILDTACGLCYRGRLPVRGTPPAQCLTHGLRGCWRCFDISCADSFLTSNEILAAMGQPVSTIQVDAIGAIACAFAELNSHPPATRTRTSKVSQAGNGMMTTQAGAMFMAGLVFLNRATQNEVLSSILGGTFLDGVHYPDGTTVEPTAAPMARKLLALPDAFSLEDAFEDAEPDSEPDREPAGKRRKVAVAASLLAPSFAAASGATAASASSSSTSAAAAVSANDTNDPMLIHSEDDDGDSIPPATPTPPHSDAPVVASDGAAVDQGAPRSDTSDSGGGHAFSFSARIAAAMSRIHVQIQSGHSDNEGHYHDVSIRITDGTV